MASQSATEAQPPAQHEGESEPLLGGPGDASQPSDKGLEYNLILGTGVIAQLGIWILVATIWVDVLQGPIMPLFTPHPLLNSAGVLLIVQAILIVQPTTSGTQKRLGANVHGVLNSLGVLLLILGLILIEANKFDHGSPHFTSAHGIFGLITYILFVIQALVGITQLWVPQLYGGEKNAKALYKYHRWSGYLLLIVSFVAIALATQTGFNVKSLHIPLWVVIVTAIIVLVGTLPRVKLRKLGLPEKSAS